MECNLSIGIIFVEYLLLKSEIDENYLLHFITKEEFLKLTQFLFLIPCFTTLLAN